MPSITPFVGTELGYNTPFHEPGYSYALYAKISAGFSMSHKKGSSYFMLAVGPKHVGGGRYTYMSCSANLGYEYPLSRHTGIRLGVTIDNFILVNSDEIPDVFHTGSSMWGILATGVDNQDGSHFGIDLGVTLKIGDHIKLGIDYSVFNFATELIYINAFISPDRAPYHDLTLSMIYEFKPQLLAEPKYLH